MGLTDSPPRCPGVLDWAPIHTQHSGCSAGINKDHAHISITQDNKYLLYYYFFLVSSLDMTFLIYKFLNSVSKVYDNQNLSINIWELRRSKVLKEKKWSQSWSQPEMSIWCDLCLPGKKLVFLTLIKCLSIFIMEFNRIKTNVGQWSTLKWT